MDNGVGVVNAGPEEGGDKNHRKWANKIAHVDSVLLCSVRDQV